MDNIEIQVHNEINDYKEKIYFLNFRQWIFAIIIVGVVIPVYFLLKDKIGEEPTSYIIIAIAGILGFIGFVKIHELEAEKILPYWARHYFFFAKPVKYITDQELLEMQQKKRKRVKDKNIKSKKIKNKEEIRLLKKQAKEQKLLEKAKKKYSKTTKKTINRDTTKDIESDETNKLTEKISKLSKEEKQILLELLEK